MQCPKCQTEVPDWHYYCSVCCAPVQANNAKDLMPQRGLVETVGLQLLTFLLLVSLIGGSLVIARAINWKQLFHEIRESVEIQTRVKARRQSRTASSARREAGEDSNRQDSAGVSRPDMKSGFESVRSMPHKIEELPSLEDLPDGLPTSTQANNDSVKITKVPESTPTIHPVQNPTTKPHAVLGVEQYDAKQSGGSGSITINSYTPARVYIDGQFSGSTPRIMKLIPGDYHIRLIADGYEDWTRSVRLKSQQQVGIMASMKKKPSP